MQTTAASPYTESTATIYELLFCDRPGLYHRTVKAKGDYPWNVLLADKPSAEALQSVINDSALESRLHLLACNRLLKAGGNVPRKELLGVVIEVGLAGGLDTLAAYKDGTARYINHSEKMIFWDAATAKSNSLMEQLFTCSRQVVDKIGPWDKERLAPPPTDSVRLSFLVSDGLYFGQGPFEVLEKDPMAGPVIYAATQLMVFLTEQRP